MSTPRINALFLSCLFCLAGPGWNSTTAAQETPQSATANAGTHQDSESPEAAEAHEDLDALLWVQTSAEYVAITRQTFRLARLQVGDALVDPTWTASTEQQRMFAKNPAALAALPAAIIVDVDETILDNSVYQTSLIESGSEFSRESWKAFVRQEVSLAIPGSKELVDACRAAGVTVLFVTNREHDTEDATRSNLIRLGLMKESDGDVIYTKYEQEDWTSDKQTRREFLAKQYRILLLIGDDLKDFVSIGYHPESKQRRDAAGQYAAWWGTRWIAMPNPNYGGWEQSAYGWKNASSRETKLKLKRQKMRH